MCGECLHREKAVLSLHDIGNVRLAHGHGYDAPVAPPGFNRFVDKGRLMRSMEGAEAQVDDAGSELRNVEPR
jgi:hypothetical protein